MKFIFQILFYHTIISHNPVVPVSCFKFFESEKVKILLKTLRWFIFSVVHKCYTFI